MQRQVPGKRHQDILSSMSNTFAASEEFTSQFASLTDAQRVNKLYRNMFSNDPNASAGIYWTLQIQTGAITIAQAARYIGETATGPDATALLNKISAATAFTTALDTTSETVGYSGTAYGLARNWISGIANDASRDAALNPAALSATVATVTGTTPPPPTVPALAIERGINSMTVSWATSTIPCYLQSTDTPQVPGSWAQVGTQPTVMNGTNYLPVQMPPSPKAVPRQFYRIRSK